MSIISENIKRLRIREDMEQMELAERIGVSNKTISSWECARTEPNMGMIEKLCVALNCTKSDLVDEQPTVLTANDATASRLLKYANMLAELSEESRDRIFHYIEYEKQKEEGADES